MRSSGALTVKHGILDVLYLVRVFPLFQMILLDPA